MKHKVADLEGVLLDAAVAMAEGLDFVLLSDCLLLERMKGGDGRFRPSVLWAEGGPIIERERISVAFTRGGWRAVMGGDNQWPNFGPAPLTAGMRAYVASKFGEWVELP